MRYTLSIFTLIFFISTLSAQDLVNEKFISLGYFGNFLYQPGLQASMSIDLKTWQPEEATDSKASLKSRRLFVRPQITYYAWPKINQNFALGSDIGYRRLKPESGKYISWSIGLAYLIQSQVVGLEVSLGDGNKIKVRENWNAFLPTLNYEFGKAISENLSWYSKFSAGWKLSTDIERRGVIFMGLGLNYKLN